MSGVRPGLGYSVAVSEPLSLSFPPCKVGVQRRELPGALWWIQYGNVLKATSTAPETEGGLSRAGNRLGKGWVHISESPGPSAWEG